MPVGRAGGVHSPAPAPPTRQRTASWRPWMTTTCESQARSVSGDAFSLAGARADARGHTSGEAGHPGKPLPPSGSVGARAMPPLGRVTALGAALLVTAIAALAIAGPPGRPFHALHPSQVVVTYTANGGLGNQVEYMVAAMSLAREHGTRTLRCHRLRGTVRAGADAFPFRNRLCLHAPAPAESRSVQRLGAGVGLLGRRGDAGWGPASAGGDAQRMRR